MKKLFAAVVALLVVATAWSACPAQENKEEKQKSEAKTQPIELAADLTAEVPANWKSREPASRTRTHEFALPSPEKGLADGILFVAHFGKGQGGGLEDNLKRWYGMVEQPDGSPSEKVAKKAEIKTDAAKITWLDMSGTYLDRPSPMSPNVTKRPKYRVFAAMIDGGKDGPYWVRAYGPEAVMQAQRDGFERFLKSIAKK